MEPHGLTSCHQLIVGPSCAYINHQEALATVATPTYAVREEEISSKS